MVNLSYGTVTGTFMKSVIDSDADQDADPDLRPVTGSVVLRPNVSLLIKDGVTIFPQAISCDLVNGVLTDAAGRVGVKLVASDTPGISSPGFTYTVQYNLSDGTPASTSFLVLAGQTIDLSAIIPVTPSTGTPITLGAPSAPIAFTWDGTHYQPAALKLSTDRLKLLVGPIEPSTDGVAMQPFDQWINTAA